MVRTVVSYNSPFFVLKQISHYDYGIIILRKLNLENNYKDLAIQARKDATTLVEKAYEEKKIKEKSYQHYKALLEAYTKEMLHYNHQQFYKS